MKTKLKFLVMLIITSMVSLSNQAFSQGVGINATGNPAHSSAGLDVDFTNKGFLCPRITTAQRDAISTPAEGLLIFNTTTKCFEAYVSGTWNTVSCPTACTPPTAPVSNAASGIACTSFTANWTASAGATAYLLDVATDAGFTSFVAGYNNLNVGNVTSSPVSGLAAGTAYYYRVRATTACISGNSGTQNPTTLAAPTAAPTAGAHTPSQTQIVWNWNVVAGATGYKWNTANDYATATDNGASTTKTQTGLTCNTAYTLYVWAYNACGNFATPVTLTQTTSACCPCIVAGFPLRRPIPITNTSGSALTNYQVKLDITYDTDMKADFADLRFRDGSCTDLPYWVETYTASTSATVWVEVPSIPSPAGTTIYMYYGNPSAASTSDASIIYISYVYRNTYWNDAAWHDVTVDAGNAPTNFPMPTFTIPHNWNLGTIGCTITAGDTRTVSLGYSVNAGPVILIGSQSAITPGTYLSVTNLVLNAGDVIHWWAQTNTGGGWWQVNDAGFTIPTTIRQYVLPEPTPFINAEESCN